MKRLRRIRCLRRKGCRRGSAALTSPDLFLRQVVDDVVEVGFGADIDVLAEGDPGGRVDRAGGDADVGVRLGFPEQVAAAARAEAALRLARRAVPCQGLVCDEVEVARCARRHGRIVAARPGALRAMAGDDGLQRTPNLVTDAAAQASPGGADGLVGHGAPPELDPGAVSVVTESALFL